MSNGNCTDGWWLNGMVLTCVRTWFVRAHKIAQPNDLDPTKKFTDAAYGINFANFLQLCDYLSGKADGHPGPNGKGAINVNLTTENCAEHIILNPAWRQTHQNDVIADFVTAIVNLILNPPAAGV